MIIELNGNKRFVAKVSRKSKIVLPNIVSVLSEPWLNEQSELNTNNGKTTIKHDERRFKPNLSQRNATITSASDIVEVKAATKRSKKNNS